MSTYRDHVESQNERERQSRDESLHSLRLLLISIALVAIIEVAAVVWLTK